MPDDPILYYRYEDVHYAGGVDEWGDLIRGDGRTAVELREYRVIKETPKGVWIDATWRGQKFIRTNALKHWAVWSKEEALHSFIARKKRQRGIYATRHDRATEAIRIAEKMLPEGWKFDVP